MTLIRGILRLIHNSIFLIGLSTMPIWIIPFLTGLIQGPFLLEVTDRGHKLAAQKMTTAILSESERDRFSLPDTARFYDIPMPPYHIVQLRHPMLWWTRLGLERFEANAAFRGASSMTEMMEILSRMNTMYLRNGRRQNRSVGADQGEEDAPWHHFIFASAQPARLDGMYLDKWDAAFDELLSYHCANPAVANAAFHYISCPSNFLCDAMFIRGPALLHLTTQTPTIFNDSQLSQPNSRRFDIPGYRQVTVRVMEFPITDPELLGLAPGVFPSPFNQLHSVTADAYAWERYRDHRTPMKVWARLQETLNGKKEKHNWVYAPLRRLEDSLFDFYDELNKLGLRREIRLFQLFSNVIGTTASAVMIRVVENVITFVHGCFIGPHGRRMDRLWSDENTYDHLPDDDKHLSTGRIRDTNHDNYLPWDINDLEKLVLKELHELHENVSRDAIGLLSSDEMAAATRQAVRRHLAIQLLPGYEAGTWSPKTKRDPHATSTLRA